MYIYTHIYSGIFIVIFSSVQLLSHVQLFTTPWITACQASLSITNSQSSLRLMSIELVMPSSHLILCCPLLLLPPIPPSIRVFSNEWILPPLCILPFYILIVSFDEQKFFIKLNLSLFSFIINVFYVLCKKSGKYILCSKPLVAMVEILIFLKRLWLGMFLYFLMSYVTLDSPFFFS